MKKLVFISVLLVVWMGSCKHEILNPGGLNPKPDSTGTGIGGSICFETDVLPIFQTSCAKSGCHDAITHEEGYVLDTYNNIMREGIKPYNAAGSKLYKVLFENGEDKMPKDNPDLTTDQKNRIAQWINEGAVNSTNCSVGCDETKFKFAADVQPILNTNCVGCHNNSNYQLNGGVNLSNYNGVNASVGKIPAAIQWTSANVSKHMPQPPANKLPACQANTILNWINAGALNN
jgi:hypothetical protein